MADPWQALLRKAWRWARRQSGLRAAAARLGLAPAQVDVPEVTVISPRPSPVERPRLNLLLPTIEQEYVFGGLSTALQFFDQLKAADTDVRVILTDIDPRGGPMPRSLRGWETRSATAEDVPGRWIVPLADRAHVSVPVRSRDIFVATAWWTAYCAQRVIAWQSAHYGAQRVPLVYLVQDHEPGFYPLSTRYLLARSTYEYAGPMCGVFNTGLLRDYFLAQPYRFSSHHAFEPELNPSLAALRAQHRVVAKERLLLIYGRPGVPRNAFELLCQGVREWSLRDPASALWRIESLGEAHQDIELHRGVRIVSRGKVSLEAYAQALLRAGVGVSLMLSPHPSYPPLEMAEFGMQVITNSHENKDLGLRSAAIRSLGSVTPEAIADALAELTAPWRDTDKVDVQLPSGSLFAPPGAGFDFIARLREELGLEVVA